MNQKILQHFKIKVEEFIQCKTEKAFLKNKKYIIFMLRLYFKFQLKHTLEKIIMPILEQLEAYIVIIFFNDIVRTLRTFIILCINVWTWQCIPL